MNKHKHINFTLFKVYFLTSLFTFSGGLAMLKVIKQSLVDKHELLSEEDFYNYAGLSQSFPGVIAVTNACFVGKKVGGNSGMFIAAFAAILPAFIFMLIATILYYLLPQEGPIYSALNAVRAVSSGFILSAGIQMAKLNLTKFVYIMLAVGSFILIVLGFLNSLQLILIAIIIAIFITWMNRGNRHAS